LGRRIDFEKFANQRDIGVIDEKPETRPTSVNWFFSFRNEEPQWIASEPGNDARSSRYVQTMLKYRQAIFEVMTFPRRRFLHLAGWASVLAILPTKAAFASARPFSRIGDLMISHDAPGITINGRVRLTRKEYKLLTLLWVNKDIVVSREIMLKHLYAGVDEPELKIIDVFISMLRFKIAKATNGEASIKIDAVPDRGYVLRET
jgi:hypothetical protein